MTLSDTHFTDNELFHLAIAAARQQHEATLRHLKTLLARNPQHAEAHYLLGTAYATLGMMEEAAQSLSLALAQAPQLALARFQLGLVRLGLPAKPKTLKALYQRLRKQAVEGEPALQFTTALLERTFPGCPPLSGALLPVEQADTWQSKISLLLVSSAPALIRNKKPAAMSGFLGFGAS